jgi:hypothetical protein
LTAFTEEGEKEVGLEGKHDDEVEVEVEVEVESARALDEDLTAGEEGLDDKLDDEVEVVEVEVEVDLEEEPARPCFPFFLSTYARAFSIISQPPGPIRVAPGRRTATNGKPWTVVLIKLREREN